MKLLERAEKLEEAVCSNCSGTGSYADHHPQCDGSCSRCPEQHQCSDCYSGFVVHKITANEIIALRDQVRELVSLAEKMKNDSLVKRKLKTKKQRQKDVTEGILWASHKILNLITGSKGGE